MFAKFAKFNLASISLLIFVFSPGCQNINNNVSNVPNLSLTNINMKLTSSVFLNNEFIPAKYTCDGENINPPLTISDIPANTKSLALIVDDPDAPAGDWVHWLIFNIDPETLLISENSIPKNSTIGLTSSSSNQYEGPCPPSGIHHYHFKLYALDTMLNLQPSTTKGTLLKTMENHILDYSELIGLYQRKSI